MRDLKGKEIFLAIGISVLVISFAYYLLYLPKQREIIKLQKEIKRLYKNIEDVELMVSRIPNPEREIKILQERLQRLKEKVTEKEQIPRILQQLFQKTSEFNIEVISIRPREDIKKVASNLPEGVSKVYIEIKVRCPYRTLLKYLEALNNLPLLFSLEDLLMEKTKEGVTDNLDTTLLLSAYVMA